MKINFQMEPFLLDKMFFKVLANFVFSDTAATIVLLRINFFEQI